MKNPIGICTWSLGNDRVAVTEVMKATGLKHLHLGIDGADQLREAIQKEDWKISCTMVAFPQEDYSTMERIRQTGGIIPDDCWESNREIAIAAIKKTSDLGVTYLSTHAGFIDHNDKAGYAVFSERMLELADVAKEHEVTLLMETGQETALDLKFCLEDLNHPSIGVNFDPANMILYEKGDPIEAAHVLAPWIRHVHIKDATSSTVKGEWGAEVPWGDGEVPHAAFLQALEDIGYLGALAVEREAGESRSEDIQKAVGRL